MSKFITLFIIFTFSCGLYAQEAAFDEAKPLTDEEEYKSGTYIHQGMADKKAAEMCNEGQGGFKDICRNRDRAFDGGTMGTIESMLPAVTMAYTMITQIGGGKFKAVEKNSNGEAMYEGGSEGPISQSQYDQLEPSQQEGLKKKKKEKTDYCGYIPMAGEAINLAQTQMMNQKNQQAYQQTKPEARQAGTFYTLAKAHKDQAKASKLQMGVWGATTGCYAAYLAFGGVSGDWKIYAKMAGSTLITLFYKKKIDAHKKRAKILEEMAKELPQAGDCNPFTHTSCFCNESTSFAFDPGNYNKFCVPDPFVARNKDNDAVSCVTQNGQPDPSCSCVAKKTCINRVLQGGALDFGIPPTMMKDPLAGLKPLSEGFGTGNISSATDRNLANARKALEKYKPLGKITLDDKQKETARSLSSMGIPKPVAAMMARNGSQFGGGTLPPSFTSGLGEDLPEKTGDNQLASINRNLGAFKAGGRVKRRGGSGEKNPFAKFGKKKNNAKGGAVMENDYYRRATAEAEIIRDPGVSIFKVINNRYQVSGWKKFPSAFSIEETEEVK
ncbi:MAG: hypothetical protein CME62_15945 [Halobacteriovoraceae bacterium]|nr:hypothetical protein [Halobacteriovoraceae bacterium]|tara:strand:- start:7324 stop:8985 length:1662 start_codon:yes stop_codon:yes gene_type:complete